MNGWLVDTDIMSELRRQNPNVQVKIWVDFQPRESLFVSVVSIAEVRFGIDQTKNDAHRLDLTRWLDQGLRQWFLGRILGIGEDTLLAWLEMVQLGRRSGHTFAQPDLFIAATAKVHDLCIVTRNAAHFVRSNVPVFDPWENLLTMPGHKPIKINGPMTLDRVR